MTKCEIIIIKYGLPELEAECVASVEEHTKGVKYKLTVHDNYEADEGLSKVWNRLIGESDAEYICLLNNDTRTEEDGWLRKLLECFDEDDNLGAIGPMTNASTGPQGQKQFRTKHKHLMVATYPLVAFCLVFPKEVWEDVGGFDEEYELYGEDSDFSNAIQDAGYECMIRTDVFIFHHGKASTPIAEARGKDILGLKKAAKARYNAKWRTPERIRAAEAARKERAKARREQIAAERMADMQESLKKPKNKKGGPILVKRRKGAVGSIKGGTRRYGKR